MCLYDAGDVEYRGKYALGLFCTVIRPYVSGMPKSIKGFMLDFFDVILEKGGEPFVQTVKHREGWKPAKTSVRHGVWEGVSESDLVKFFRGARKVPQWKAADFYRHFDVANMDAICDDLTVDALNELRKKLLVVGIKVDDVSKVPEALGNWLLCILEANASGHDWLVDGPVRQPELNLDMGIPLGRGSIVGGKLRLVHSTLPWPSSPKPPVQPDDALESGYITQMKAAFAQHCGRSIVRRDDLPVRFRHEYDQQREYFYDAEGLRRNLRDVMIDGEDEFKAMKVDLCNGVNSVCWMDYVDGLARMRATLTQAAVFPLAGSVMAKYPTLVNAAEKKGMCHMLVNDRELEWVFDDE